MPENVREHFEYPSSPPSFSGSERERGHNALIQYLLKVNTIKWICSVTDFHIIKTRVSLLRYFTLQKRNMLLKNADDSNHDSAESKKACFIEVVNEVELIFFLSFKMQLK